MFWKYTARVLGTAGVLAAFLMAAGCQKSAETADHDAMDHDDHGEEMATLPDTTGAAVWAHLQDAGYTDWPLWPGKAALYEGGAPHGARLTTYVNAAAQEALSAKAGAMPPGAIIVKENYMPDETLAAVTVMYKVEGYNPAVGDWFWTKHLPDGTLDKTPNGMAMQGRLAGCQGCHAGGATNDYVLTSSLSE